MECLICFDKPQNPVGCGDPACIKKVCAECCGELIKYSANAGLMPKCPAIDCNAFYLYSQISNLGTDVVKDYSLACFEYIVREHGTKAQKKNEQEAILYRLRDERKTFIREKFPAAIALVAETAMKSKLHRIEKQRATALSNSLDKSKRRCMNMFCDGHLDTDFKCLSCESKFCNKCERRQIDNHKCKQEDIESIDFIRGMIHCPHCNFPVEKSSGCDNITCSHCGKNFLYNSGDVGGSGSKNEQLKELLVKRRLSVIYDDYLSKSAQAKLEKIEATEPPQTLITPIINIVSKYYKGETKKVTCERLVKSLNKYLSGVYKRRLYHQLMSNIEDALQRGELETDVLDKTLNILKE